MNDRQRRIYEAAVRTLAFITAYFNDLKIYPVVTEMRDELTAATETLTDLGADKVTKTGAAKDATIQRGDARDNLLDLMQAITGMWRRIAPKTGGDVNKFRMPRGGDQDIQATAESYADQAEPLKVEFTKRGFPADFVETLRAAIAVFAAAVNESDTTRRERAGTNAALEAPVKTCKTLIDDFDPLVRMHYRDNPRVLAEWLVASHVERAPQRETNKPANNPATN